jgi:hypothetical protein
MKFSKNNKANAMIVVESTKKRILRHIPDKYIPRDSFPRDYGNLRLHILGLNLNGKFWTITSHADMIENESPTDLFMAKHCATEVEEVYGLSMPTSEKIKLGLFVLIIIAIVIVIFMIASTSGSTNIGGITG